MKNYLSPKSIIVALLFVFIGLVSLTAQPKTFFVAPNGNDNNSGITKDQPFASINCAILKASSSDTIFVMPGNFKEVISFKQKNGIPEKPIYLFGYSRLPNDYPVIDAGEMKPVNEISSFWLKIENSSWITIGRMKFVNAWAYPVVINNSSYISFSMCHFYGAKRVINAMGENTHHLLVEKCYWDQGGEFLWKIDKDETGADAWLSMHHEKMGYYNGSLIDFSGTGGSIVIRHNTIVNAYNAIRYRGQKGYDSNIEIYNNKISNVRDNDFEPEYYAYNLHIYHNISHNIHRTLSIDNVEGGNIFYYGNVITTDNDEWAQKICTGFWKIYGKGGILKYPIYAFNNSLYGVSNAFRTEQIIQKFKHYNNAYFFSLNNGWILEKWDTTDEFDHDMSNKPWPANITGNKQEKNGKICDVKFTAPEKRDLTLQPGSPAIDAGKVMSFKDFDWEQSYTGKAPDVGAFENGVLVEGPAFRFIKEPGSKINYEEKPRMVRDKLEGDKYSIFFSSPVVLSSINVGAINLFKGDNKLEIESAELLSGNYKLVLKLKSISENGNFSISFSKMPIGINGESATYWASTIKIHK